MRHNGFGEAYCHTVAEVRATIERSDNGWHVYATEFSDPDPKSKNKWDHFATCEIRENQSGDLVCYIEAGSTTDVKAMVAELKIGDSW